MADKTRKAQNQYLVKAKWRGTALLLRIEANDEDQAWRKARNEVLRMRGAASCEDIEVIRQVY